MSVSSVQVSCGQIVSIFPPNSLHQSLQDYLAVPTVAVKDVPAWKGNSWLGSCSNCKGSMFLATPSHCRACGCVLCGSCAGSAVWRSIPELGFTLSSHLVCSSCSTGPGERCWKTFAFNANSSIRETLSGVLILHTAYTDQKQPFSQFQFSNALDYIRCAFLCSEVMPVTLSDKSYTQCMRDAWLQFALTSLTAAANAYVRENSVLHKHVSTLLTQVRIALSIARMLAVTPHDGLPLQCWDADRTSFIESGEDGLLILCLLSTYKSWQAVGDFLFAQKWLVPAFYAYKISSDQFSESEFMKSQVTLQQTTGDKIFYLTAAALLDESTSNVLALATLIKSEIDPKWAIEILCVSHPTWSKSALKAKGHLLLVSCFESLGSAEDSNVLMAGYHLLVQLLDGNSVREVTRKLNTLQTANIPSAQNNSGSVFDRLRYQFSLNSPELLSSMLLKAFKECDYEELKRIVEHVSHTYADVSDISRLPHSVLATLMLPQAVLDIVEGRCMVGVRALLDSLLMSFGAGMKEYSVLAAEVLSDPHTRLAFQFMWRNELKRCVRLNDLLAIPWLSDLQQEFDNSASAEFKFGNLLRNSAELRSLRLTEKAVDGVVRRDGPFEAAMCCLDLISICPGQAALTKMLLKAAWYLKDSAQSPQFRDSLTDAIACLSLGKIVVSLAEHFSEKLSPAEKVYFGRQIVFVKLSLLQGITSISPSRKQAPDLEEYCKSIDKTLRTQLTLQCGFPILTSANGRAFDDIVSGIVLTHLSNAIIERLECKLAGLVSYEQWSYWKFEGVWQGWVHNPLNDPVEEAEAQYQKQKQLRKQQKSEQEEDEEFSEAQRLAIEAREHREEMEFALAQAKKRADNALEFLELERGDAVCRYLIDKKWQWESISKLMNCMCVPRTSDGYIEPKTALPARSDHLFSSFDGVEVNRKTGAVRFLLTESRRSGRPALFGWREIREIMSCGSPAMVFSLDSVDPQRPYHPFQILHFMPEKCRGTSVLSCMFHTDYLLKFLSCGMEISCAPPFRQRETKLGFLKRLPAYIQKDLSVIADGARGNNDQAHRFWIDAGLLPYSEVHSEEKFSAVFGKQAMRVKKHKLRLNSEGKLVDDDGPDDPTDLEAQFARNFTRHYDTISQYFPEFAMLAEFTKMIAASVMLLNVAETHKSEASSLEGRVNEITKSITASLSSTLGSIEFPLGSASKVNDAVEDHVRETDRLNGYRLTYDQKNQVRRSARSEIETAFTEHDKKQVKSLASSLETSEYAVRQMLTTKDFTSIAREKAKEAISLQKMTHESVVNSLRREGLPVDGDIAENIKSMLSRDWSTKPASDFNCDWVPAVFRLARSRGSNAEDNTIGAYRVYGGVSLKAQLSKQVIDPPATSQYVTSAATLSAQRALGGPFTTAAKIDNQNRANQDFFNQRVQIMGQRAADAFNALNGTHQQNMNIVRSFENNSMRKVVLQHDTQAGRYFDNVNAFAAGGYFSTENFANKQQARDRQAVLSQWNGFNYHLSATIPAGTTVFVGTAAPQGSLSGGAVQMFIPDQNVRLAMANSGKIQGGWTPGFFKPNYNVLPPVQNASRRK